MVVSARRRTVQRFLGGLVLGASALACLGFGPLAAVARADTGDPLLYYGGPVAHSVTGVLVDWGPRVNPVFTNATTGDPGLLKYFASQSGATDDNGAVLAQYMDSSGQNAANSEAFGGQYEITPTTPATTLSDGQVAAQLVGQIGAGALPAPAGNGLSTVYLVVFPSGITICDGDGCSGRDFCSYHGSTLLPNGTNVLYDVLPDDTTGPMTQGCGGQTPLRNQTMYLSHELAESITDPLVDEANSYGPPLAWYDAKCPSASAACGELADKCNQQPTAEGGWTVQLMWSNLDDACVATENRYGTPSVAITPPQGVAPGVPTGFLASASDPAGNTASASWNGHTYAIASGIASLTWNWGDGTAPSSGAGAVHTFASPGIYNVSVTATDNLGFVGTASEQLAVWGSLGPPVALTGTATGIGRTSATVAGTVDAAGLTVGYRFDFGPSSINLNASTPVSGAPTGTTAAPVHATLRGLLPGRRYYFRLDAIVSGVTLPGPIESFTTSSAASAGRGVVARSASAGKRAKQHQPKRGKQRQPKRTHKPASRRASRKRRSTAAVRVARVTAAVARVSTAPATIIRGQTLAGELRHGLRVSFHCTAPCHVTLDATLALPGRLGIVAVPRVLATGFGTVTSATPGRGGVGTATLQFSSSARAWLSTLRSATFVVSAFQRQ
jgi:hypothetical protein